MGLKPMSQTHPPVVTIGVPFYNAEGTLLDTIRSVFAQTISDWELLLVDDASTDGSVALAESVDDPRVVVVRNETNRRQGWRHNEIADLTRGRYLAKLDADDLMHPTRLEKQITFLEEHTTVDCVDSAAYIVADDLEILGVRGLEELKTTPWEALRAAVLIHPAVTGRTEWFQEHHYDPTLARIHDYELWCRTAHNSRFARIQEPLCYYRKSEHDVPKLLAGLPEYRRVYRTLGPSIASRPALWLLTLRTYAYAAAARVLSLVGADDVVALRRARRPSPEEAVAATKALEAVMDTPVPGID